MRYLLTLSVLFIAIGSISERSAFGSERRYTVEAEGMQYGFIFTVEPRFPPSLERMGIDRGSANFVVVVNDQGILEEVLVVEATHLPFAKAAEEAIWQWDFLPPIINSQPTSLVQRVNVEFESTGLKLATYNGVEIIQSKMEEISSRSRDFELETVPASDLDRYLIPLETRAPLVHDEMLGDKSELVVNYRIYIDPMGEVRIVTVSKEFLSLDVNLLKAGEQALLQWKFEPPRMRGRPVVVQAIQPMLFKRSGEMMN